MSEFKCEVVPVKMETHPNADSLSIVRVYNYPVCVRTEDWVGKTKGVYIPVDAVCPDTPEFEFLGDHKRIKARKLRGVFSMGMLFPAKDEWEIGYDAQADLGVTKYEEPETLGAHGEAAPAPSGFAPKYTDIERILRHGDLFQKGEMVYATEKIHGANARYTLRYEGDGSFSQAVLHIGSKNEWKRECDGSAWHHHDKVDNIKLLLHEAMCEYGMTDAVLFGEVYGNVQDLKYGMNKGGAKFAAFDLFDCKLGKYAGFTVLTKLCIEYGIDVVPLVYAGPFDIDVLLDLVEKDSAVGPPGHIREGLVIRPTHERESDEVGRVILKLHSQRYLLRKGA